MFWTPRKHTDSQEALECGYKFTHCPNHIQVCAFLIASLHVFSDDANRSQDNRTQGISVLGWTVGTGGRKVSGVVRIRGDELCPKNDTVDSAGVRSLVAS